MKRSSTFLCTSALGLLALLPAAKADYPAAGTFDGHYTFTADRQLNDNSLSETLPETFKFDIETTLYGTNIINFILPTTYTEYDATNGELTLKTNYGTFGTRMLGFADGNATWTGMGSMYGTLLKWQVEEDGTLTIPEFTVLDLKSSNKVVARYTNCVATVDTEWTPDQPGTEPEKTSFKGVYVFKGKQTAYTYEEFDPGDAYREQSGVTQDYELRFTVNEYNQIWVFDGYSLLPEHKNTLRNLGNVTDNRFVMDADMYNGIEWVYITEEDNDRTEAKLFGGSNVNGDWTQGSRAFTLTKNADGTFSLTNISLWQRTMETIEGEGDVSNRVRVHRPIRLWENLTFVSYDPDGEIEKGDDEPKVATFDVDEGKITVDRETGFATMTFRALRAVNFDLENIASFTTTVSGLGETFNIDADATFAQHPTLKTIAQASTEFSVKHLEQTEYDVTVSVVANDEDGEEIAKATNDLLLTVKVQYDEDEWDDSGVAGIDAENGAARYYNLQGVEVANPRGGIFIKIEGGKAEKLVISN